MEGQCGVESNVATRLECMRKLNPQDGAFVVSRGRTTSAAHLELSLTRV